MTQRGVLFKIGPTVKQWEINKRQVVKNQNSVPNGNKVEIGDFDAFDTWFGQQRKFIRDYLRAEDHAELEGLRAFMSEEDASPGIQLHFNMWTSMSRTDMAVNIQRLSRLMDEYHVAHVEGRDDNTAGLLCDYQNSLEKEQSLVRQIDRARENYHRTLEAYNQHDVQRVQAWDMSSNKYSKSTILHQVNICRKTYEDILKFEAGKVRASLMRAMYDLERILTMEEDKRLIQLLAVVKEYFQLLQTSADLTEDRKIDLVHQLKQIGGLQKRTKEIVKSWINDKRCPVEFPEFQDLKKVPSGVKSGVRRTLATRKLMEVLTNELKALQFRFGDKDIEELTISRSSSSEDQTDVDGTLGSLLDKLSLDSKDVGDVLFKNVTEIHHRRSTEASDLDVEDVECRTSDHVIYPTATVSAKEFALANQKSKHCFRMNDNVESKVPPGTSGLEDRVPGCISSDEDVIHPCSRQTRQITILSSDEEVFSGDVLSKAYSSEKKKLPSSPAAKNENKDRKLDLKLSELTGIYVVAQRRHKTSSDEELVFNIGDVIKQEKPTNEYGMAYGYVKKTPFGSRHYGYYPVDKVGFHKFGRKFQRP